jgi:hypothetical protein
MEGVAEVSSWCVIAALKYVAISWPHSVPSPDDPGILGK